MPRVLIAVLFTAALAGLLSLACQRDSVASPSSQPEIPKPALFAASAPTLRDVPDVHTRLHFLDGTADSGIHFQHMSYRSDERYMPEVMGSGVAVADINRDGAPDVICINAGNLRMAERPAEARNHLFLNDGKGHFHDATDEWKLPSPGFGMGIAAADYNNDGWIDLLLTMYGGGEKLLKNTGKEFVDVTKEAGLESGPFWSTSAGWIDMDHDGNLDLYVARYIDYTLKNALKCYSNNVHIYCTPVLYNAFPDRLLRNNGDGTFTDVSKENHLDVNPAKGLAVCIADINGDGNDDIFVADDTTRNMLLVNDGKGHFNEIARQAGVAYSEIGAEEAGMGADVTSLAGNNHLDIVCTHFQGETTAIYRQGAGLFFREVSDAVGVGATARARFSFGVKFFDADNDGDEDLIVANGHISDQIAKFRSDVSFEQPNTLYENVGDGKMVDVTVAAGPALQDQQVSRGMATGDLNGDGLLDFVVSNNNGTTQIGINQTPSAGHFVSLWLEGTKANRCAIGTMVEAKIGTRTIRREVLGASSYLSVSDYKIQLGLADAMKIDELTLKWPGGESQVIRDLAADKYYHVIQGKEPEIFVPGKGVIAP